MNINLKRRVEALEDIYNPDLKVIIVLVEKADASVEAAKARVLKGFGLSEAPEDCVFVVLNLFRKPMN